MTRSIDIIGQLPPFVVLVIILQRFDAAMWGLPDIQISQTTGNGPVSFYLESDKTERTRFQLAGHRAFGAGAWSSPVLDGSEQSITRHGPHDTSSNAPIPTLTPPCPGSMTTLPMRRCSSRSKDRNPPPSTSSTVTHQGSRESQDQPGNHSFCPSKQRGQRILKIRSLRSSQRLFLGRINILTNSRRTSLSTFQQLLAGPRSSIHRLASFVNFPVSVLSARAPCSGWFVTNYTTSWTFTNYPRPQSTGFLEGILGAHPLYVLFLSCYSLLTTC